MSRRGFKTRCAALLLILSLAAALLPLAAAAEPDPTEEASQQEESAMEETLRTSGAIHAEVSPGVRNIVKRACQLTDIVWTPLRNIEGWKNYSGNRFLAGRSYTGLPYAQPHRSGSYVPWQTSLTEFLRQVANPDSAMYSAQAVSQVQKNPGPYYACECSAFVSWAWGLPQRETTHTLPQYSTVIGGSISNLQVGDCLNLEGKHARLVTDITYDAHGSLTGIEICEETPPAARRIWYREGSSSHPLTELQTDFLDKGYVILRSKTRDLVGYSHSCAVPLAGDVCPVCGANPYRDLPLNRWYAGAVAYVCNQGLMSGTSADTFSPNAEITRAMAVMMLWRMEHSPDSVGTVPFRDVKTDAYYYAALRWAWARGIVSGTGADRFSPKAPCTRAQVVTFLWQTAGKPNPKQSSCGFRDVKPGDWYYKALLWAVENGVVSGKSTDRFCPKDHATRAETAAMFQAVCQLRGSFMGR